jgi:hypothetical protein
MKIIEILQINVILFIENFFLFIHHIDFIRGKLQFLVEIKT